MEFCAIRPSSETLEGHLVLLQQLQEGCLSPEIQVPDLSVAQRVGKHEATEYDAELLTTPPQRIQYSQRSVLSYFIHSL